MNARRLLQDATGLNITEADAQRAMRERMAQLGMADSHAYLRALAGSELSALTELVVVPESWLFRDPGAFSAATDFVQRRLALHPARPLRILSLPCASGEEPYSMAMALDMAGVAPPSVRIDAIDLSQVSVRRAIAGHYTRNAFRGADLAFRERYFMEQGGGYQLCDAIRARVGVRQGNLFELDTAALAGSYDIVFCRNLLIYFDDLAAHAAAKILHTLLADDGLLFAGYAEVPALCRHGFAALRIRGAFALEKAAPDPKRLAPPLRRAQAVRSVVPAQAEPQEAFFRAARHAPAPAAAQLDDALAQAWRRADGGDFAGAAALCHTLLATDPSSADAYFILGIVSECQGQVAAAADYWRRCVYLRPGHYEALCHLALLARQSGDAQVAEAYQERAARIYARRQTQGGAE
ncbi:CheR family methyltransferase [Massilia sp. CMS3.1]|uniref:CheR family methyltransferase n=1 Tax=Massilia sp. CMS3.1 TaxID=3373083 RepID=UPI003EE6C302